MGKSAVTNRTYVSLVILLLFTHDLLFLCQVYMDHESIKSVINWNYPVPRQGLAGAMDRFIGPGATSAEGWVQGLFAAGVAIAALAYAAWSGLEWTILQFTVAILLAFDMAGGIVTNATSSAKRWYHRAGQGFSAHLGFVAVHLVHIFVVAWLFRGMDWFFFGAVSTYLLAAAVVILKTPLYLQRPVALGIFALSIPLSLYALSPTPGMEWFVPFLALKLLVSHLLREEPYRPAGE
jgi:hypothetical protein